MGGVDGTGALLFSFKCVVYRDKEKKKSLQRCKETGEKSKLEGEKDITKRRKKKMQT